MDAEEPSARGQGAEDVIAREVKTHRGHKKQHVRLVDLIARIHPFLITWAARARTVATLWVPENENLTINTGRTGQPVPCGCLHMVPFTSLTLALRPGGSEVLVDPTCFVPPMVPHCPFPSVRKRIQLPTPTPHRAAIKWTMDLWLTATPLGRPVDPEVKITSPSALRSGEREGESSTKEASRALHFGTFYCCKTAIWIYDRIG